MSNIKTHIIAVAVLAAFAGAAQAATSVTLYGRIDVGYGKTTGLGLAQSSPGELRLGVKGSEDLGAGMAATFQMEGRFDADTGAKTVNRTFFDRESTVGLKGSFGHIRLGRSISAMEQGIGFVDVGRRASLADTYVSAPRHSNALFYNYTMGAFSFGGDVTTKGGYNDGLAKLNVLGATDGMILANEGVAGEKVAYGVFAKYKANGFEVGAAYQADNANKLTNPTLKTKGQNVDKEWGVAAAYTYKMLTAGAGYAAGKGDGSTVLQEYKTRVLSGFLSAKVTPSDTINLVYRQTKKEQETIASGALASSTKETRYGLGYIHALSKRTSVYADVARINTSGAHTNTWDVAVRHSF